MTPTRFFFVLLKFAFVFGLFAGLALSATSAEVVILKDGFVIQGTERKETTVMTDPATGRQIPVAKDNGFDLVDEGPKWVIFSAHAKQGKANKETKLRPEYKAYEMTFYGRKRYDPLPQFGALRSTTEFDAKWFRNIKVSVPPNSWDVIEEQITYIDPYWTYMVSPTHLWREGYRTAEFEPAQIRKLLTTGLFKLTNQGIAALKNAEVPDDVLAKLNSLKDKELLQAPMVKELTKLLTTAEQDKWLALIMSQSLIKKPELAEITAQPDAGKRIALAQFMLDAGWLKSAKDDIEEIRKLWPDGVPKQSKESFEKLVKDFDNATIATITREAELALGAGRYKYAEEVLSVFPEKLADMKQIDEVSKLKARLKATQERYEVGRQLLRGLLDEVTGMDQAKPAVAVAGGFVGAVWPRKVLPTPMVNLVDAGEKVFAELHPDSAHRIESFVVLAIQAEKEKQQGRVPTKKADALLATVISGWAMGQNGANPNPEQALKIWAARELVLAYQRTEDLNTRNKFLHRIEDEKPVGIDELAQIISLLPPAEPENLLFRSGTPAGAKNGVNTGFYKRETSATAEHPKKLPYYVKLPPEYHHGRAYPVLIVLGAPNFGVESLLGSLSQDADRHGYILVAPEWTNQFDREGWQWKGEDHWYVTGVLREIVKNFCIDNDRVFLIGMGEGANMAIDVGMSHPDLFAGVLPMNPIPKQKIFNDYWKNAQALPFFMVAGELAGSSYKDSREYLLKYWMPRGFPSMMTVYKGRGLEWYAAEIPVMFDWMGRKKRVSVTGVLKLFDEKERQAWTTMRSTDNHFYWLGVDKVQHDRLLENQKGK
ncbi:MAG TPA: PHB depolymerase family esterase, partial [Gemmata sp.]|nr:PHB depolymerase family esterase [Gemmata sp.]